MQVWNRLLEAIEEHGRVAMVTVAATSGSTPREAGARLIIDPAATFAGTIGGGTLEWRAIAEAQSRLGAHSPKRAELRKFILGPDMGQCCGGQVDLLFEVFNIEDRAALAELAEREAKGPFSTEGRIDEHGLGRRITNDSVATGSAVLQQGRLIEGFGQASRPLLLFGAGHVGRAIAMALGPLPFAVTWLDPRPDAFPQYAPANVRMQVLGDPAATLGVAPPESFILIMTHSHPLDYAVLHAALADDRFPYVGLIGSKSKRARFEHRLARDGFPPDRSKKFVCPIGVRGIHSKQPALIAAATVAELLILDEALHAAAAERATAANVVDFLPVRRT